MKVKDISTLPQYLLKLFQFWNYTQISRLMASQKDVHNRQNLQKQLMTRQERGLEMYCRTIITPPDPLAGGEVACCPPSSLQYLHFLWQLNFTF